MGRTLYEWLDDGGNMNIKKTNSKNIAILISAVIFAAVSIACTLYYVSVIKKYEAATQAAIQSQAQAERKFQNVAQAYQDRNAYLLKLTKKTEKAKELVNEVENLDKAIHNKPLNIANIEAASIKVNQIIFAEIEEIKRNKKSQLFTNIQEVRHLEQYDRYIDLARAEYSNWTYEIMSKQMNLAKSILRKNKSIELEHFKVDHLIRSANSSH